MVSRLRELESEAGYRLTFSRTSSSNVSRSAALISEIQKKFNPALLHPQLGERDPRLRLAVNPLGGEAAVIDARRQVCGTQGFVGERRPALADIHELLAVIR